MDSYIENLVFLMMMMYHFQITKIHDYHRCYNNSISKIHLITIMQHQYFNHNEMISMQYQMISFSQQEKR